MDKTFEFFFKSNFFECAEKWVIELCGLNISCNLLKFLGQPEMILKGGGLKL